MAVVAAQSTREGGELRPTGPTGGQALSGRAFAGQRQGRDRERTNLDHRRPVDCTRAAAALREEPDACMAHVRVCGGAGWVTTGSPRQAATVCTHRQPTHRQREDERPEGLSGSAGPGRQRAKRGERGRPPGCLAPGRPTRPERGRLMVQGALDPRRGRGGRERRPRGAGGDSGPQPSQDTWAGQAGPASTRHPPCGAEPSPGPRECGSASHGGARCETTARRDLCGGRRVTGVPTATTL